MFTMYCEIRKPSRILTTPWQVEWERSGRNVRDRRFSNTYFDPHGGGVLLSSSIDREIGAFSSPKAMYNLYAGTDLELYPDAWIEGESAFGDGGYYVGFAGDETYPITSQWEAYRNTAFGPNWPVAFAFHWTPPSSSYFEPRMEFWPRVLWDVYDVIDGRTYYFAPLGFYVDSQSMSLTVCEYKHDSLTEFSEDPTTMLRASYQHALDVGAMGVAGGWITFEVIPVIEQWTRASDGELMEHSDFILRSPQLVNGGFVYQTSVDRTVDGGIPLFPEGYPGMRSLTGGASMLTISPLAFATSGYVLSQPFSKREEDSTRPTLNADSFVPDDCTLTHTIVYPESYPAPVEIPVGEDFRDYRVQTTFEASTDGHESPVLYTVKPTIDGAASDLTEDAIDISHDVSIHESMSDDLTGYQATVTLRNLNGTYDALAHRPVNEIRLQVQGIERAIIYTQDPSFKWYETPTKEALRIVWQGGDSWIRMKSQYVSGMPDFGGQSIKTLLTDYMTRLGFDPDRLHIADSLDEITLPVSPQKGEPVFKPEDSSTADQFVSDLREKFFSTYPTGFDGVGDFWVSEPVDPFDPANIKRTYYLSHAQASAAGDIDPYFCMNPEVSFKHEEYKNEIWVVGVDPATQQPIVDVWVDQQSQVDPSYVYYTGERRLMIAVTTLPTLPMVTWYLNELVKVFGKVRRTISFETRFDPLLMPKDFIMFHGLGFVFQVMSTDVDIASGKVSFPADTDPTDGAVYGYRIEAVEWPV